MDYRKVRRFEDLLFNYFEFRDNTRFHISGTSFTLRYKINNVNGIVTLYTNKTKFFQTSKVVELKQMLKLLFGR